MKRYVKFKKRDFKGKFKPDNINTGFKKPKIPLILIITKYQKKS